jgi:hypothetical protein
MASPKTQKNSKIFNCELCDFNTSNKNDYNRHIATQKHRSNILATDCNKENSNIHFMCEICDKEYKNRTGLWRHKKKCQEIKINVQQNMENSDKDLIMMLVKQNSELLEVIKNGTHNTTISNNNNKTFNLNLFLNETCKDAMNITDFVDSIKLQLSDLEKVGDVGYIEGISDIITTNLKALDITQRPIHCTDKKREVLYVKDEDKWEKEDEEKKKIRKAINKVADKNSRLLLKFREVHPDCNKSNSKYSDQYNKIIVEAFGGQGNNVLDKEDKIIKNISTVTTIEK